MQNSVLNYDDFKPICKWKHPILALKLWLKGYRYKKFNYIELEKIVDYFGKER